MKLQTVKSLLRKRLRHPDAPAPDVEDFMDFPLLDDGEVTTTSFPSVGTAGGIMVAVTVGISV
jgi:hypothetical protein